MRKRFNLLLPAVLFLLVFLMIIPSPMSNGTIVNRENVTQTQTKKVSIEFSHSEHFTVNIPETQIETTEFNGSEFLDALDEFNQTGINVYVESDTIPGSTAALPGSGTLSYLVVNITESYIYDANEPVLDPSGEVYYKIWINGNYTRYPQEGAIK